MTYPPSNPPSYEETAKQDEPEYRAEYGHFASYQEAVAFITQRLQSKATRQQRHEQQEKALVSQMSEMSVKSEASAEQDGDGARSKLN